MGPPCWDTATDAPEARGDPGEYQSAGIRRADVATVSQGIANARRYVAACEGGDLDAADLQRLVVEIVNLTGEPPQGGVDEGAPFVRLDVEAWRMPTRIWPIAVEGVRHAATAYAHAWLDDAGCTSAATPSWLRGGLADSMTIVLYLYNKLIVGLEPGVAAAAGVVLFVIIFTATLVQRRIFEPKGSGV
jgi:hypothetical protein